FGVVSSHALVNVLGVGRGGEGHGAHAGFFADLADSSLHRLFSGINVSLGQGDHMFAVQRLALAAGLDHRHPPLVLHVSKYHSAGGEFTNHEILIKLPRKRERIAAIADITVIAELRVSSKL